MCVSMCTVCMCACTCVCLLFCVCRSHVRVHTHTVCCKFLCAEIHFSCAVSAMRLVIKAFFFHYAWMEIKQKHRQDTCVRNNAENSSASCVHAWVWCVYDMNTYTLQTNDVLSVGLELDFAGVPMGLRLLSKLGVCINNKMVSLRTPTRVCACLALLLVCVHIKTAQYTHLITFRHMRCMQSYSQANHFRVCINTRKHASASVQRKVRGNFDIDVHHAQRIQRYFPASRRMHASMERVQT